MQGKIGVTSKGDDNSSYSEEYSDAEYEMQEIRLQIGGSQSSLIRRQRKQCCTLSCMSEWSIIVLAFIIFYVLNGLFTWALIEAMLANTFDALVTFGVLWVVFTIVYLTLIFVISTKKLRIRQAREREVQEEEIRRREGIKAALQKND